MLHWRTVAVPPQRTLFAGAVTRRRMRRTSVSASLAAAVSSGELLGPSCAGQAAVPEAGVIWMRAASVTMHAAGMS